MKPLEYKIGVYFDVNSIRQQEFGFGLVWCDEKYMHFNLFNFELAIGRTAR